MTDCTKPVTRMVRGAGRNHALGDDIAVTIHPAGFITFREAGRRRVYTRTIDSIILDAISAEVVAAKPTRKRKAARGLLGLGR